MDTFMIINDSKPAINQRMNRGKTQKIYLINRNVDDATASSTLWEQLEIFMK